MDRYNPHPFHAVLLVVFSFAVFLSGSWYLKDNEFIAAVIASGVLLAFSILIMAWVGTQVKVELNMSLASLSDSIAKLSHDQWQALGIRFPFLRIKWNGTPLIYIEDTDITVQELYEFMEEATPAGIPPRRDQGNGEKYRSWAKIYNWLGTKEYLMKGSAAGQRTEQWSGQAYFTVRERYLQTPVIADADFMAGAPAPIK